MPAKRKADRTSADSKDKGRLPFEPQQKNSQKAANDKPAPLTATKNKNKESQEAKQAEIPQVVSQRMMRRMALFCGVPTTLGMLTFVVSYIIVSHEWLELPNYAVLIISLSCFGLGFLGLSYGVLSASWEEETPGSLLGFREFGTNWKRTTSAWRSKTEE
ncbi:MAG: PAM68 family protein [Cyanosarcina radialis HA8281-LM2]|jgi:hypothetical protein|nr:PAM68 family protein [Cyanosarcina radialis HA8281-LM2]